MLDDTFLNWILCLIFKQEIRMSGKQFLKKGAPFIVLAFGSWIGLQQFAKIRYFASKKKMLTDDDLETYGIRHKKSYEKLSPEDQVEIVQKELAENDGWENIRGPRPWEDQNEVAELNKQQRARVGREWGLKKIIVCFRRHWAKNSNRESENFFIFLIYFSVCTDFTLWNQCLNYI